VRTAEDAKSGSYVTIEQQLTVHDKAVRTAEDAKSGSYVTIEQQLTVHLDVFRQRW
jgi:hypothetical protein